MLDLLSVNSIFSSDNINTKDETLRKTFKKLRAINSIDSLIKRWKNNLEK